MTLSQRPARVASEVVGRLVLDVAAVILFAFGAQMARDFPAAGRWFPLVVGIVGAVLAAALLLRDLIVLKVSGPATLLGTGGMEGGMIRGIGADADVSEGENAATGANRSVLFRWERYSTTGWFWFAMLGLFVGLIAPFGFWVATALWLVIWWRLIGRESWRYAIVGVVIVTGALYVLSSAARLRIPTGLFDLGL